MRRAMLVMTFVSTLLSLTVSADDSQPDDRSCRPPIIASRSEIVDLYLSLSDLSLEDQRQQMWSLSSSTRAALWTYNMERYLRDHPAVSDDQRELFRRGIALITSPAWFDIQEGSFGYAAKSFALAEFKRDVERVLSPDAIVEVFIRLGPEPRPESPERDKTKLESGRFSVTPNVIFQCSCGSRFDCGSSASYSCYDAWCYPTKAHCGYYADEACWGKCKETGE